MPITHVSDTAHWIAMYRAMESERSDSLFDDRYARGTAGGLFGSTVRDVPFGESMAWTVIVRSAVMDEMILYCIANGAPQVLNLGAGLDTRALRLKLPPTLRRYVVDRPNMLTHRRASLKKVEPRCENAHVAADVNDTAAHGQVLCKTRGFKETMLAVSDDLLVRLEPAEVGALAASLHAEQAARWWLTYLISPVLLAMEGAQWHSNKADASAPSRVAPRDSACSFGPSGLHEISYRSTLDEVNRLQQSPPMAQCRGALVTPGWPGSRQSLRSMAGKALMGATNPATPIASRALLEELS